MMLLRELFHDDEPENLHPRTVRVFSGNDSRHVQKVVVTKAMSGNDDTMDVHVTCVDTQPKWKPRELDVEIDFLDEQGLTRTLVVYFHKGETYVEWVTGP